MQSKLLRLLEKATKVTYEHLKWPTIGQKQQMKPSFHQTQKRQNQNIKWIYNKTAYVEFQIFTPVLINFT